MTDKVFVVDDEEAIRDGLKWLLESYGYRVETYPSGESFLGSCQPGISGCLILDVRMPGMSGLELFDHLKKHDCTLPVIFLTGHGDIAMAVDAMHKGAADFIEKPAGDSQLVEKVALCLKKEAERVQRSASTETIRTRLASLTGRELEVMQLILASRLNKNIADQLNISIRTVEVHRARILEKMGVSSAVELARILVAYNPTNPQS